MSPNWGTVIASGISAIIVWFITNVVLGPWVDRRKVLAAEKRKYALEPAVCGKCGCQLPSWFMRWIRGKDDDGRITAAQICRECLGEVQYMPHPYEEEGDFNERVEKKAGAIVKAMKKQLKRASS